MKWIAWISLCLAGLLSITQHLGVLGRSYPPDLGSIPDRLGPFQRVKDHPLVPEDLGELVPDRFRFSEYRAADGLGGNLFLAFYARARTWSGRPHDVGYCYLAAGWRELEGRILTTPAGATLFWKRLEREDRQVVIVYWWQRPGVPPAMALTGSLKTRLATLFRLRPDLVTVSWELEADEIPSESDLLVASDELIEVLERALEAR